MAKRKGISKKTRFDVFKRDSFTCQYCGKSAPDVVLEVDHINPVSKGGDNDISNLITACFDCNRGKRDKKLTENQTIKKQKEELDKLNQRREQLEMMAQWRTELLNLENEEADKLMKLVSDSLGLNSKLTDTGKTKMKRLIKKYGFDEVLESSIIAYEQYDINIAFSKIEPIIKNKKMQQEHPEMKDLFYIRAIVKNKFSYYDLNTAIMLLKKCYELGATIDSLKDFTRNCSNWTQWKNGLNEFIEENEELITKLYYDGMSEEDIINSFPKEIINDVIIKKIKKILYILKYRKINQTKICPICNREFVIKNKKHLSKKYCSKKCREISKRNQDCEYRKRKTPNLKTKEEREKIKEKYLEEIEEDVLNLYLIDNIKFTNIWKMYNKNGISPNDIKNILIKNNVYKGKYK